MIPFRSYIKILLAISIIIYACNSTTNPAINPTIADTPTNAKTQQGKYISWKEHLIDDVSISGVAISGSDGLVMGDLDKDGFEDVVSVHESDTEYGVVNGHIRIAFGSDAPDKWELVTLAAGEEAAAAEDVDIADVNGDGYLDIIAACELAHLIYFQNPGENSRTTKWERIIPDITKNRGSFIRVFFADFDKDGKPEVVTANKGNQSPGQKETPKPISWFEIKGNPLSQEAWIEHELIRVNTPINAQPKDLDQDGDVDIIGGSLREGRIFWFENLNTVPISFKEHPIEVEGTGMPIKKRPPAYQKMEQTMTPGFNMDYFDFNQDGRLDIVLGEYEYGFYHLLWLEQPATPHGVWQAHSIGSLLPDFLVGFTLADINEDGRVDIMSGGYSTVARDKDTDIKPTDALGRLAWFEQPNDLSQPWTRHDISRRKRGMFDKFIAKDMDNDGDIDFVSTRGNSVPYDGVFWLEQVRTEEPVPSFVKARKMDSEEVGL